MLSNTKMIRTVINKGASHMSTQAAPNDSQTHAWQDDIFNVLKKGGIKQVSYVPDAGHAHVIRRIHADPDMRGIVLTTEEEGVAIAAGAWLGGDRHALLMQSSGVGNCINMMSLLESCRFPFLTLVTMRGEYAEFNPWQGPMSRATPGVMEAMGITVYRVSKADEVEDVVSAALDSVFEAGDRVAILLSQSLIGRKKWVRD
jgi:sulfopyruvate decarboxylase alpha subunit